MRIKGVVFSGVLRGKPLIEIYYYRLVGLLGFEPYMGTFDVKLTRSIDTTLYATKSLEHVLMDGKRLINAYLAPVNVIFKKNDAEEKYPCWAMQQADGIYGQDVVEIIAKDSLKEKFGIEDGNIVELEFSEKNIVKRPDILESLPKGETQLMKR